MKNLIRWTTWSVLTVMFLSGCSKDDTSLPDNSDALEAREQSIPDGLYEEAEALLEEAIAGNEPGKMAAVLSCASVVIDTTVNPRTVEIDFGSVNCLGNDGRYRRGRILGSYSIPRWQLNSTVQIDFDGYFVNNREVFGQRISTLSSMANNQPTHSITAQGGVVGLQGDSLLYTCNRSRVWTQGYGSPQAADDVREISGTASVQRPNGALWTLSTQTPLVHLYGCTHFSSGSVLISSSNRPNRLLDYGNTGCDSLATVTVNGNSWSITLP